ncbi:MAG: transglycosylase SLT domain-containing protein, partial [Nannocystaceae bacterium]
RKSPELAPVEDRLRVLEARALLGANEPAAALACVASVKSTGAHAPDLLMIRASGHQRTRAPDVAKELYQEFLKTYGSHALRHEARIKLARVLANEPTDESRTLLFELYLKLAEEVPRSDYGQEAIAELPDLAKALGKTLPSEARSSRSGTRLEDMRRDLKRGRYNSVISQVNSLLSQTKRPSNSDRCEALYLKGSAIFKQRKRAKSRPVFELAARTCKQAGTKSVDTLVKSRYQAGRGRYAEGLYTRAGKAFESLARDHKDHTYADDAWVLAGESWASAGNLERERKAYEQSLIHHPRGDKAGEARRRLILQAFSQKRYEDILSLTNEGQKGGNLKLRERAKLHYFAGRAHLALGQESEASQAWIETIRTAPLSYPALQAFSRLRDLGEQPLGEGLAVLEAASARPLPSMAMPDSETGVRASILARLGLGKEAREELQAGGIHGWPEAALLAQAGMWADSQRALAKLGTSWRTATPAGEFRETWALAHPRAFSELVRAGEHTHQVPHLLTFAVMQTESRFDPGVTSWAGARGLLQLMPGTAKDVARRAGVEGYAPSRLYNPTFNLDLGMRYLSKLVDRFGGHDAAVALAVPSYNAGAGNVDKWLGERGDWDFDLFIESIPFDETRKYTQSVLERWMVYRWVYAAQDKPPAQRLPYLPLKNPGKKSTEDAD